MIFSKWLYTIFVPIVLGAFSNKFVIEYGTKISPDQVWQPKVGSRFQIVLESSAMRIMSQQKVPETAEIFDIDLFDTPKELIHKLQASGRKVICYFSAGGSESWRPDYHSFSESDKGDIMKNWRREQWLDIRSPAVFDVMSKRIKLASEKGCNAIDPDNIDAFGDESKRGGGFPVPLTRQDSVAYVKRLASEARKYGMSIGLKNAEAILPNVQNDIQFAINEECATYYGGCQAYESFLMGGKPIFHIEYAKYKINGTSIEITPENTRLSSMSTLELEALFCLEVGLGRSRWVGKEVGRQFSTVIKGLELDRWVLYCDRSLEGR